MNSAVDGFYPGRLWSLWDMLRNYFSLYQLALRLEELRTMTGFLRQSKVSATNLGNFRDLLVVMQRECLDHGLSYTADMAKRAISRPPPEFNGDMFLELNHLNDSLSSELEKEAIFRIPPARKDYFERDYLFGPRVAYAFPSCARDIQKAGSCYALEQEDACVHHLMMVLERGLHALAGKVGVTYQPANWQSIINEITRRLNSLPKGEERDFYNGVNAQFGFLKHAYRNHSEHAHDEPYDMEKALSILNHVRTFMQELEQGGIAE